jgi:hypothetical protein
VPHALLEDLYWDMTEEKEPDDDVGFAVEVPLAVAEGNMRLAVGTA